MIRVIITFLFLSLLQIADANAFPIKCDDCASILPAPSIPGTPTTTEPNSTDGTFRLSWSASSGLGFGGADDYGYQIFQSVNNGAFQLYPVPLIKTAYYDFAGIGNGTYNFKIQACNFRDAEVKCSSESAQTTVYVRYKPSIPAAPANLNLTSTSYTINWSKPSGTVTYYNLQERIAGGTWSTIVSGTTVTSRFISGKSNNTNYEYRVQACNQYSWACSSYSSANSVKVRLKPSTPATPSNINSVSTSYTVNWSKPSGTVTYYSLQERVAGGSWSTIVSSTSATSKSISGKVNGTNYEYRVRACNQYSWACSAYSGVNSVKVRLKPSTPAAPTRPSTSTGSAAISWVKPAGNVSYYDLQKRLNNAGNWLTGSNGVTTTSKTLAGLTDGLWDFKVRACNQYSWACSSYSAVSSDTIVRLIPSVAGAANPTTTTDTNNVTVSWTAVSSATYYNIQRRNNLGSWATVASSVTGTSKALSGFTDGSWDFRVQACNGYNWACSSYGVDGSSVTWRAIPSIPTAPSRPATSTGSAAISWVKPAGNVSYYDLQKRLNNAGSWLTGSNGVTTTSKTLTGLTDGLWDFKVRACNQYSWACSSYSAVSSDTIVRLIPSTPAAPTRPSTSTGSAAISWAKPVGNVSYYDLKKRLNNAGSWLVGSNGETTTSKTLTGLTDGLWDFKVRACNQYSWACSSYSAISSDTIVRLIPSVPATPTGNPATNTSGSYTVNWVKPAGTVTAYDVQERINNGSWTVVANDLSLLSLSFSGKSSGDYDYQVRACNQYDWACSAYSGISLKTQVRKMPSTPSITNPTSGKDSNGQFDVVWSSDPEATYYNVQKRVNGGSWSTISAGQSSTSYNVNETSNSTYEYQVKACNDFDWACSNYSVAKTIEIVLAPNYANSDKTQVTDAGLISPFVPANQTVGALEGQAGVSGGAASYNIPIAIPPGRNGMQPNVSLNYSSRGGNGIAGVGWSLSAGSSIRRCGAMAVHDGVNRGVQYDSTYDRLCLNGQRLINVSGSYGLVDTIYRTEIDSFSQITQLGGGINSPSAYFKVQSKNGRVSFYGKNSLLNNSKIIPEGAPAILTWLIDSVRDPSSNAIHYVYELGANNGEVVLSKINYTGTSDENTGSDVLGNREVAFTYEARTDVSGQYLAGSYSRNTLRLKTITTKYDDRIIRDYNMLYSYSGASDKSLLNSVEECAFDEQGVPHCLPKTTFSWSDNALTYELKPFTLTMADGSNESPFKADSKGVAVDFQQVIPRGDVNGDGVKDWLSGGTRTYGDGTTANYPGYFFNAEGENGQQHDFDSGRCSEPLAARQSEQSCSLADFNLDGRTDTWSGGNGTPLKLHYTQLDVNGAPVKGPEINTFIITTRDLSKDASEYYNYTQPSLVPDISDYNGDGYPDLLIYNQHELQIYLHNGAVDGTNPYTTTGISLHVFQTKQFYPVAGSIDRNTDSVQAVGDIDGNGIPDFVVSDLYDDTAEYFYPVPKPVELKLLHYTDTGMTFSTVNLSNYATAVEYSRFLDINGDGLADYLYSTNVAKFRLNQGDGSFGPEVSMLDTLGETRNIRVKNAFSGGGSTAERVDPFFERTLKYAAGFRTVDIDGDGRDELLVPNTRLIESCLFHFEYDSSGNIAERWFCGDELYGTFRDRIQAPSNTFYNIFSSMPGAAVDEGIYQYDAIYFDEAVDGTITTRKEDSGFVGSLAQSAFIDVYGNGLTDFIFAYGPRREDTLRKIDVNQAANHPLLARNFDTYIYANSGSVASGSYAPIDMLKSVTKGGSQMSVQASWNYAPLSTGVTQNGGRPLYQPDYDAIDLDPDYFHFTSSMYVVTEFSESNGVNGNNATEYRYKGAMYNNKGRGFQGFNQIAVDNLASNISSVTDFHQKFPRAGSIQSVRTCLITDDGYCAVSPISRTDITQMAKTTANSSIYSVFPTNSVKTHFDLVSRAQISQATTSIDLADTDSYGNILKSTTTINNGFSTVESITENNYLPADETNWWVNKLDTSTVTVKTITGSAVHDVLLDPTKSIETQYTWTANRQPDIVTVTPLLGGGKVSVVDTNYNAYGLPTLIKTYEPAQPARQVSMTYSNDGTVESSDGYFPYAITNSLGTIYTKTYPEHGQVSEVIDLNELASTTSYDPFGRVEQVSPPLGTGQPAYSRFAWCQGAVCDSLIDNTNIQYKVTTYQAGVPESSVYKDKFNRVLYTKTLGFDGTPIYVSTQYDALGRTIFTSVPSFDPEEPKGTHFKKFDSLNRLTEKVIDQPHNQNMQVVYSYVGHRTDITATAGVKTLSMSRTHSGTGQLMRTTDANDPIQGVTQYAYDAMGNPIILQDAKSNAIKAKYNALGQKLSVDDPNMGLKTFTYTAFGEVDTETDANGDTTDYDYDDSGRLILRQVNAINEATFNYDNQCNGLPDNEIRANLTSGSYSRSYTYDTYCRPSAVVTNIDGTAYEMSTQYDGDYGRIKAVTYPTGLTATNLYNAQGYLTHNQNAETGYIYQQAITMDARGQLTVAKKANGLLNEASNFAPESGQMLSVFTDTTVGNQRHRIEYVYDDFGNLSQQDVENKVDLAVILSSETYRYDDLHRMITSDRTIDGAIQPTINYNYDAVGNFTLKDDYASSYSYGNNGKTLGGNAGSNAVRSVTKTAGGTATYDYDLNGNLLTGDGKTLTYNAFNKPTNITKGTITSAFSYGADQLRYKQIKTGQTGGDETTIYIDKAYEEISYNGEVKKRVYLGDAIITETISSGSSNFKVGFVHRDRLGSVVTISDENANVVDNKSYDPFGKPRKISMELIDPFEPPTLRRVAELEGFNLYTNRGFTDHEHLDDAELIHMNGRVYDYNLGRFLSVDPFIQDPGNSQSMNPYSYILNNPLSGTDPSGYTACAASRIESVCDSTPSEWGGNGNWNEGGGTTNSAKSNGRQRGNNTTKLAVVQNAEDIDFKVESLDTKSDVESVDLSSPASGGTSEVGLPSPNGGTPNNEESKKQSDLTLFSSGLESGQFENISKEEQEKMVNYFTSNIVKIRGKFGESPTAADEKNLNKALKKVLKGIPKKALKVMGFVEAASKPSEQAGNESVYNFGIRDFVLMTRTSTGRFKPPINGSNPWLRKEVDWGVYDVFNGNAQVTLDFYYWANGIGANHPSGDFAPSGTECRGLSC